MENDFDLHISEVLEK